MRANGFGEHSNGLIFNDKVVEQRVQQHMAGIRAKRSLTDMQVLVCFCVWGVRDSYGTGWIKGAFAKSIEERGPKSTANQKIAMLWQHDMRDPIGRIIDMWEDDEGAFAVFEFDDLESVPSSKRAKAQIASGTINGYSFGFEYIWDRMEYDEKVDTIWVREVKLYELSAVTIASVAETHTVRSPKEYETRKLLFDEQIKDFINGLPKSKQIELRQLLNEHKTLSRFAPDDENPPEPPKPEVHSFSVLGIK